jgi:hypothetical protein
MKMAEFASIEQKTIVEEFEFHADMLCVLKAQ